LPVQGIIILPIFTNYNFTIFEGKLTQRFDFERLYYTRLPSTVISRTMRMDFPCPENLYQRDSARPGLTNLRAERRLLVEQR